MVVSKLTHTYAIQYTSVTVDMAKVLYSECNIFIIDYYHIIHMTLGIHARVDAQAWLAFTCNCMFVAVFPTDCESDGDTVE